MSVRSWFRGLFASPLHMDEAGDEGAEAEADLAEIWAEIAAKASEEIASRFVASIEAALEPVRHFPLAAPAREPTFWQELRWTRARVFM